MLFAQDEETWENVTVFEFSPPYKTILLNFDEEEFLFLVNDNTKFLKKKRKATKKENIFPGSTVKVSFIIENKKRVLTKVNVNESDEDSNKFEGVYEILEGDIAFVDGRKVKLSNKAKIKCKGNDDCNCSKGRSFLDFEEIPIGSFLSMQGEQGVNGIFIASKIEVCKNVFTSNDQLLMEEVSKSFDGSNLNRIQFVPENSFNPSYGLHNGNIKVGNIDYKLLDNIKIQGYINLVGNRVLPEYTKDENYAEKHNVLFRFYVIENDIPNAMAFPNGMIFINTGLLKIMENEAQLATVLGHEISHITYEHGASRFKVSKYSDSNVGKKTMNWLKNKLKKKAKIDDSNLLGLISEKALAYTTPQNIMNMFDKKKETQSDRVGLFYMHNSGYDVREAAKFWQIMVANTKDEKFMNKITSNAWDMLNSIEGDLEGDLLKNVGQEGADMLVTQTLETIYTSHPLSIKRFGDINQLLSTTYDGVDFSQYSIGQEAFNKYISVLKD